MFLCSVFPNWSCWCIGNGEQVGSVQHTNAFQAIETLMLISFQGHEGPRVPTTLWSCVWLPNLLKTLELIICGAKFLLESCLVIWLSKPYNKIHLIEKKQMAIYLWKGDWLTAQSSRDYPASSGRVFRPRGLNARLLGGRCGQCKQPSPSAFP